MHHYTYTANYRNMSSLFIPIKYFQDTPSQWCLLLFEQQGSNNNKSFCHSFGNYAIDGAKPKRHFRQTTAATTLNMAYKHIYNIYTTCLIQCILFKVRQVKLLDQG